MDTQPNTLEVLGLYLIPGLGSGSIRQLIGRYRNPDEIYKASEEELSKIEGISPNVAKRIKAQEYMEDPQKEYIRAQRLGAQILTYWDKRYPSLLKEIKYPPVLLYCLGRPIWESMPLVAVVGSRHPSHYGRRVSNGLAYGLSKRGICVVSGLAAGIDTSAHEGAISSGGHTVAVLGTGLDVIYPKANRSLFEKIPKQGAIITEFPLGTPPDPKHFPIRNRIISGISLGVVVVEATRSSGSLITASMAAEEGREVFAVPGSIESMKSTGCHYLIRQGAKLVEKVEDILEELRLPNHFSGSSESKAEGHLEGLNREELTILDHLERDPIHIDELSRALGIDTGALSSLLISLELKGLIAQLPGKFYVKGKGTW
ncbi:MAG: DNA-processing protein DprA [Desulfatiglandales bacterium]